jgi:hypothetical protein
MLRISWVTAQLVASQEGLSSMSEWVSDLNILAAPRGPCSQASGNQELKKVSSILSECFIVPDKPPFRTILTLYVIKRLITSGS